MPAAESSILGVADPGFLPAALSRLILAAMRPSAVTVRPWGNGGKTTVSERKSSKEGTKAGLEKKGPTRPASESRCPLLLQLPLHAA